MELTREAHRLHSYMHIYRYEVNPINRCDGGQPIVNIHC